MNAPKILPIAAIGILLATSSFAGQRSRAGGGPPPRGGGSTPVGRAVPRGSINPGPGRPGSVYVRPGNPGYGRPYYGYGRYYYGYPYSYGYPYAYGYPGFSFSVGFGFGYPYGYATPYAYGYYPSYGYPGYVAVAPGRSYGGVRIEVDQRDAQVFVDGYYVGVVNDFDGTFQQVNLEPGPHRVEVRRNGFEPERFDVNVQPGQTVTYRAPLRPSAP